MQSQSRTTRQARLALAMLAAVAAGLDEGRTGGPDRMAAYFHHLYRVLESAAKEPGHDLAWGFPILGIEDPDAGRSKAGWAPAEDAALAAYRKEEQLTEQVRRSLLRGGGKGAEHAGKGADGGKGAAAKASAKAAAAKAPMPTLINVTVARLKNWRRETPIASGSGGVH